jgi:hypothetical protein
MPAPLQCASPPFDGDSHERRQHSRTRPLAPWDNPMGTDGFEFIEYAAPDPAAMGTLFSAWVSSPLPGTATRP